MTAFPPKDMLPLFFKRLKSIQDVTFSSLVFLVLKCISFFAVLFFLKSFSCCSLFRSFFFSHDMQHADAVGNEDDFDIDLDQSEKAREKEAEDERDEKERRFLQGTIPVSFERRGVEEKEDDEKEENDENGIGGEGEGEGEDEEEMNLSAQCDTIPSADTRKKRRRRSVILLEGDRATLNSKRLKIKEDEEDRAAKASEEGDNSMGCYTKRLNRGGGGRQGRKGRSVHDGVLQYLAIFCGAKIRSLDLSFNENSISDVGMSFIGRYTSFFRFIFFSYVHRRSVLIHFLLGLFF